MKFRGKFRVMVWVIAFAASLWLVQTLDPRPLLAQGLEGVHSGISQPSPLKKKPPRRSVPRIVTMPPGLLDPTEPRPVAAPIDPVVSLRLLEAEIRSSEAAPSPLNNLQLQPPPQVSVLPSAVMPPTPRPEAGNQAEETGPITTTPPLGQVPPLAAVSKFVPSYELVSLWVNIGATDAIGEMSRASFYQQWQELTADKTASKKHQRGFQSLLNVTAVLVDGRDHRLALETLRQRSQVWLAVQNGFDFMALPQDQEQIMVAAEKQNPNYRPPTRYDDLRGVLLLQGLTCPLVTRFVKITEGDWLVSCSHNQRFRIIREQGGRITAAPYDWRE